MSGKIRLFSASAGKRTIFFKKKMSAWGKPPSVDHEVHCVKQIMCLGFIFKTSAQTQRCALSQEPLPHREVVLKASISKLLCISFALLKIFARPEFGKQFTRSEAPATPAFKRLEILFLHLFFFITLWNQNSHKHSLFTSTFRFFWDTKCPYLCLSWKQVWSEENCLHLYSGGRLAEW